MWNNKNSSILDGLKAKRATPNPIKENGVTNVMSGLISERELRCMMFIDEAENGKFDEDKHPRSPDGRFTYVGGSKKEIRVDALRKAKTEKPDMYKISGGDEAFKSWSSSRGFDTGKKALQHFKKHGVEFGFDPTKDTKDSYVKKAQEFRDSPLGDDGDIFITRYEVTGRGKDMDVIELDEPVVYKYDRKTGEYLVADADGKIQTYFKPKYNQNKRDGNMDASNAFWEDRKALLQEGVMKMYKKRVSQPCPICNTPEQMEREYDICEVCGWEENPSDEDANDGLSITEARNRWKTGKSINEHFPNPNGING